MSGLKSMERRLDPRRHAFRPDLAAEALKGMVEVDRYTAGEAARVVRAAVPVRRDPDIVCGLETEALFGEALTVFDDASGWAWVQLARDGYVGYMPSDSLQKGTFQPTHKVIALGTFVYPLANFKSPPLMHLALNAPLTVRGGDERFTELERGGFVMSRHIGPIDRNERDYVEIAERFVGTPYLWGGRTRIGIDCSGLVQTALQAAGIPAPRDTDMQQAEIGSNVLVAANLDDLKRGDLVFWPGHVGIMLDSVMMVHANAHHMMVAIEPLPEAAQRISRAGSEIAAIKRLRALSA